MKNVKLYGVFGLAIAGFGVTNMCASSMSDTTVPISARQRAEALNKQIADEQAAAAAARKRPGTPRGNSQVDRLSAEQKAQELSESFGSSQTSHRDQLFVEMVKKLFEILDVARRNVSAFQEDEEQMQRDLQRDEQRELTPQEELDEMRRNATSRNDAFDKLLFAVELTEEEKAKFFTDIKNSNQRREAQFDEILANFKKVNLSKTDFVQVKNAIFDIFKFPNEEKHKFNKPYSAFNAQDKKQFIANMIFFKDTLEKVAVTFPRKSVFGIVEILKAAIVASRSQAALSNIDSPLSSAQVSPRNRSPRDRSPRRDTNADAQAVSRMIDVLFAARPTNRNLAGGDAVDYAEGLL